MSQPQPISTPGAVPLPTPSPTEPTEPAVRLARLQTLCLALTAAVTMQQAADVVIAEGFAALNASAGSMYLLETASSTSTNSARPEFVRVRMIGYDAATRPDEVRIPLDAPTPLAHAAARRQPVFIETFREYLAEYPRASPLFADGTTAAGACAVFPFLRDAQVLGGIELHWQNDRAFDADTRAFMQNVAQMCAQAVERARQSDAMVQNMAQVESLNARLRRSMAETHHRIKNNFQVISALVELQCDTATGMVSVDALRRIGSHARALATLHDLLTTQAKAASDSDSVSARSLVGQMILGLQATSGAHDLQSSIEDIRLPVRVGAALCLLINELVSNAGKHGGQTIHLSLAWNTSTSEADQMQASTAAPKISPVSLREPAEFPPRALSAWKLQMTGRGFPVTSTRAPQSIPASNWSSALPK